MKPVVSEKMIDVRFIDIIVCTVWLQMAPLLWLEHFNSSFRIQLRVRLHIRRRAQCTMCSFVHGSPLHSCDFM